jgi:hypothetical protein
MSSFNLQRHWLQRQHTILQKHKIKVDPVLDRVVQSTITSSTTDHQHFHLTNLAANHHYFSNHHYSPITSTLPLTTITSPSLLPCRQPQTLLSVMTAQGSHGLA